MTRDSVSASAIMLLLLSLPSQGGEYCYATTARVCAGPVKAQPSPAWRVYPRKLNEKKCSSRLANVKSAKALR